MYGRNSSTVFLICVPPTIFPHLRILATAKSFLVCASMPLAPSTSITALSAAERVRYVSSEKSLGGGRGFGRREGQKGKIGPFIIKE